VSTLKRRSKKKVTAILFTIALMIAIFPDVQSDTLTNKPPPDYGIYGALEDIQDEKNSRINNGTILSETKDRFDNITVTSNEQKVDLSAGREIITPDIPVPEMLDIYRAMRDWDDSRNNEVLDWLFPEPIGNGTPLNYHIYANYITHNSSTPTWTNASLRPTLGINLGGINPNLDRWWDVDVDVDGTDDISVFFGPVPDVGFLSGMSIDELIQFVQQLFLTRTLSVGMTVEYNIRKLNDGPFNTSDFKGLEVYVAKSLSYAGQNFILFIGLNVTNVVDDLDCSVRVDTVTFGGISIVENLLDIIDQLRNFQRPTLNISYGDIANLSGPYSLKWDSNEDLLSSFGLDVATAKILINDTKDDPYEFLNRSWVDLDFTKYSNSDSVPQHAEFWVDADDDLSSFNEIKWTDSTHICNANLRFFDSQENVTYAEVKIGRLPKELAITMDVVEKNGQDVSIIEYNAEGFVNYLDLKSYEFFDTSYEYITQGRIASGAIEYVHLFLNVTHIPSKLYLEGIFYLEDVEPTPDINLGVGIVADFIDTLAHRVISRFTRIAKTLSSIPYKLLSMSEDGSFATIDTYGLDYIDEIEFIFTSGDYATTSGNFFSFYNNTRYSEYPIAQVSLAGRISKIWYFNASFENDIAFADIEMMSNEPFKAIYADPINSLNAQAEVSNVPGHIIIYKTADLLQYGGFGTIDELRFISDYQGSYMDFKVLDLATYLEVELEDNRTYVTTGQPQNSIGEIEFLVTSGPIHRMSGNHLLLRQEDDYNLLSGRIKDISNLEYFTGDDARIDVQFTQENALNISLNDTRGDGIAADLILDPVPNSLSVNLSGLFPTGEGAFIPPSLDTTGVMGFASLIFGVATLGNEILDIIDEAAQDALNNVGTIIEDLSFSYSTDTHITLIGKIVKGKTYTLSDVDWMHGISGRQKEVSNGTTMAAKLYLTGLPTEASIAARVVGDDMFLDFHLWDFTPIHDWLLIDVKGIRDRDAMLYVNDIPSGMNLDLKLNLSATLSTIPQKAAGSIHMDSSAAVGALYGRMRQTIPEISVSEVFLDSVPRDLDCAFNLSGSIGITFNANSGIEYMFVKNTKSRDDELHDIYAILHEVPEEVILSVIPIADYDMDGSLLQTLPTLDLYSSGETLDAYIFADGKGIGQIGIVELQIVNVPSTLKGSFSDDSYSVSSTGVDYLWVHVMNLPVMEDHETKSIELVGKDIKSFDISIGSLFGNYPVIGIEDTEGGEIQLVLDHEVDDSKIGLALIDFQIKDGLPQSPKILINGGSVDLSKDSSHVIIPAPVLTLFLSVFS
jgi:hypothetical protein